MRKLILPCLAGLIVLSGCARNYVVRLNNGAQITTASKPKLDGNSYYYKDAHGQKQQISAGSVSQIQPASMAAKEKKQKNVFIPSSQ